MEYLVCFCRIKENSLAYSKYQPVIAAKEASYGFAIS
jgi:hypothetical protein